MAFDVSVDVFGAASHRNMATHLCGPFMAGAADRVVAISQAGVIDIGATTREPVLLLAPRAPLASLGLRVHATLAPNTDLTPLEFAPYTDAGSFLPLHHPSVDAAVRTAAPFTVTLKAEWFDRSGSVVAQPLDVATVFEARLFEGSLGKLLYVIGAEKSRLRRESRQIAAFRQLSQSGGDALDRFGADLAVPRFTDRIRYDAAKKEIFTEILKNQAGAVVAEPDDEYRRRLQLYYRFNMPNRDHLLAELNGPGADNVPNAGPLAALGVNARFALDESVDPFAVAIHVVTTQGAGSKANFFKYLQNAYLILPANTPQANTVHAQRMLPSSSRDEITALRGRLRQAFTFGAAMGIAPMLARVLDRVGRMRKALGVNTAINVTRAQDPASSRYELGLGVDIAPIAAAELDQMVATLQNAARQPAADTEVEGLLRAAVPVASAKDPDGAWLFTAAGLQTVHRVNANAIYLSHFPTFGLVINETGAVNNQVNLEARYQAPGDPGANAVLVAAMTAATAAWAATNDEPWAVLSDADAQARFGANVAAPAAARNVFTAAGLPAVANVTAVGAQVKALPPELIQTLKLGPQFTQNILAGQPKAATDLQSLASILRAQNAASILPLVTAANEVVLVVGVIGLPEAGINLGARRSTGFRWYVVPLEPGAGGEIKVVGSRTSFVGHGGMSAIVALGYARREHGDPYEVHVRLPQGVMLNLPSYEFLMNALEQICPATVLVNTFSLRQEHVDLDGNGSAEPLPPSLFRTYRRFRRPRHRGEIAVPIADV